MRQGLFAMNKENKIVMGVTAFSHLAVHAQMMVFPTLMLLFHHEFDLGLDTLGIMATAGAFMFGVGAIPAGFLEAKLGGRTLLLIYQVGSIIGGLGLILAKTPVQMTIGLGILGLASSIYHPAGLTILSRRLKNLSKGMAIHGVAGSLGLALGPLFAGAAAEFGSWRVSYLIWIVLQGILVFVTFFMIKRRNKPIENDTKKENLEIRDKRSIVIYYVMSTALGFSFGGFTTYMPALFGSQTTGIFALLPETFKAGFFTTLVFTSGILGQTIGGYIGDILSINHIFPSMAIFLIPAIFLAIVLKKIL